MGKNEIDMTKGNLFVQILAFSLPLMASSILQLLFNAADIIVVGKFAGDVSMAAVSSTTALVHLIVNLFIGFSVGSNVACAKYIGAHRKDKIHDVVHTSILMSIILGLVVAAIGLFASRPMLLFMGSPADVIDLSVIYLTIYFIGAPFNLFYNFGAALLRAKGDTKHPLYYLTISGILNTLMNVLLVVVFEMDVAGVAIATIFSQFVSAILVGRLLIRNDDYLHLEIKELRINKDCLGEIVRIGLPSGLQSVAFSISNVIIQSSINSFGSTVMAGSGAASNIEGFVWVVMNSFTQATQAFVAQNYGAFNYERMIKTLWVSVLYVTVFGAAVGIGAWYFSGILLKIYTNTPEAIAAGTLRMFYISFWYFICGILDDLSGMLRSTGKPLFAFMGVLFGCCILRVVYIWIVFSAHPIIENVYITYPISWIVTTLIYIVALYKHLPAVKKICAEKAQISAKAL